MTWAGVIPVLVGGWLIAAPWALDYASTTATYNDVVAGAAGLVLAIASVSRRRSPAWPAWANLLLGLWLLLAPWLLAYAPYATSPVLNDAATGLVTIACAAVRIKESRRTITV